MPKVNVALVAAGRPKKRRAPDKLDDNPVVRAKARYISTRIGLRELTQEFKGLPGCSFGNLARLCGLEDWPLERERYYDRVVTETANRLGVDEASRNTKHLQSVNNVLITSDGILAGIHHEVTRILEAQKAGRLTMHGAVALLKGLSTATKNIAIGQAGAILLEQSLASTEGSSFQRFTQAAEAKWREVVDRREELVKQAEDRAVAIEAAEKIVRRAKK